MLTDTSNEIANLVEGASPSVVQVRARGTAASGIVYRPGFVLTTGRVIGRDEHPEVRDAGGEIRPTEVVGWDPSSRLVLLKTPGLEAPAFTPGHLPRVGSLALALGRSWSNGITATAGLVSIIGGPLRTGRRHQIDQVIRVSAPMHEGFAGGAVIGPDGALVGVATAAAIRGLTVVIPAAVAWQAAAAMNERGALTRGYIGIAAHAVSVPERQRTADGSADALLVVGVKDNSPAAAAGLLVGDLLLSLDAVALRSPEDLIDLLIGDRVGRAVTLQVMRGGAPVAVQITPAKRNGGHRG